MPAQNCMATTHDCEVKVALLRRRRPTAMAGQPAVVANSQLIESARQTLAAVGLPPDRFPTELGLLLQANRSVADEYGYCAGRHSDQRDPNGYGLMQVLTNVALAVAAASDLDGRVPAVFFNDRPYTVPCYKYIDREDFNGWVDRHHPALRGSANFAAGLQYLLDMIDEERKLGLTNPYQIVSVVEGDVDRPEDVRKLLAGLGEGLDRIFLTVLYASNQRVALPMWRDIIPACGNVELCVLPQGLAGVSVPELFSAVISPRMAKWRRSVARV